MDESDLSRVVSDIRIIGNKLFLWNVLYEFPWYLGCFIREILRIVVLIVVPLDCVIDNRGPSCGLKLINFTPLNYSLIMIDLNKNQLRHLLRYGVSEYLSQNRACTHANPILCAYSIVEEFISAKMAIFIDCMFKS